MLERGTCSVHRSSKQVTLLPKVCNLHSMFVYRNVSTGLRRLHRVGLLNYSNAVTVYFVLLLILRSLRHVFFLHSSLNAVLTTCKVRLLVQEDWKPDESAAVAAQESLGNTASGCWSSWSVSSVIRDAVKWCKLNAPCHHTRWLQRTASKNVAVSGS
jgi:hypothetical protein